MCIELGILPPNYSEQCLLRSVATVQENEADTNYLKSKLIAQFKDVFDDSGPLKTMKGQPMVVELTNDSKPFAIQNARVIPFAYRDQVKQTLDELVAQAIIAPVSEPTDWIHPLVVVPKENGKVRLCVDFTRLNQFVKRPVHPLASPKYVVGDITPGARLFTTFDAKSRYWQIPLAEESQILTTFITPWGRYKFLRGPMALVLTGDEFCRRVENALGHLPRLRRVVDDILVTGTELADHYSDVENVLIACREIGITLGLEKFKFAQPMTTFAGLVISENGVAADPR